MDATSHAIREVRDSEFPEFLEPIMTALGLPGGHEAVATFRELKHDLRLACYDEGRIVGTAATFDFEMTVPGGTFMNIAGVTLVAVRPTHRRRGILRSLMLRSLGEARSRGKAVSALFASEGAIYGRFGYGLASWWLNLDVEEPSRLLASAIPAAAVFRRRTAEEAGVEFPKIWDALRSDYPGMLSRTPEWWRLRRVAEPDWRRRGRVPLENVVCEVHGKPVGYAIYRPGTGFDHGVSTAELEVVEAMALTSEATKAVWGYLFQIDLARRLKVQGLSADHPLLHLVSEPARLRPRLVPGLYVRLIDVEAALRERRMGHGASVVLAVRDPLCAWNDGHFKVSASGVERTSAPGELEVDIAALGSVYLGGFSFRELLAAGRVRELASEAAERADQIFVRERAPWCPDIF